MARGATTETRNCRATYHFGCLGLPVRAGRGVRARAQGVVVVGVAREPYAVGDVHVGLERVADVVVQPAPDAVHGVAGTGTAFADQIVPEPVAGRRRRRIGGRGAQGGRR